MNGFFVELTSFNVIMAVLSALVGVLLFVLSIFVLNKIPAEWLCDYDEEPSEELLSQKRFKGGLLYAAGGILSAAAFALVYLVFGFSLYTLILTALTYVLIMVILSDGKYYIIPDQFAVFAGILSLIFAYYDLFNKQIIIKNWWSPLAAGLGVGLLIILVNLITLLIMKKDGMGFGDVKLFAAVGIATGFPDIFIALLAAVLTAFLLIIGTLIVNAVRKQETHSYIPFGPSICIGVFCTVVLHGPISHLIELYFNLLK